MNSFLLFFGVCLLCHLLRLVYEISKARRVSPSRRKLPTILMYPNMAVLWVSWFGMCEADPVALGIPTFVRLSGLCLFIAGLVLVVVPVIHMRGVENTGRLITSGLFKRLRHPMYLGFLFWAIGYPIFNDAALALLTSLIWVPGILCWRHLEEIEMAREFDAYAAYKTQTWF